MPFLFLSCMYRLQNQITASTLTSQIFNRHFKKVDGQKGQKGPPIVWLNVCFACRFTSLTMYFPSFMLLFPLFILKVCCVRKAGETYPLHAGSRWRVSDGNVRHSQTWWRLMAAVILGVCRRRTGGSSHRAPNTVILLRIFWEAAVSHSVGTGWGEAD